ncbi:hypothetical protein N0V83_009764 [Neocucurbitaria cava]|uniref:Uncharacterized protein n=1 Tax=Neocucurbitaria cava TaxID=798079 RepID=A0A9W8XZY2_9PLEO|nr:hypothetical protein N0V83_009764 [Neocucurbitaria cava]
MAVTEIACMGIKPGLNVMDDTTKEGQILHKVEDQSKVWAFFDWESVEEHEKFAAV